MACAKQISGVVQCSAAQENLSGHPAERMLPVGISLMGTLVKVQTRENKMYEGIFRAFSSKFEIALEIAHQVTAGREDELPRHSMVHDKIIFKLEDVVKIEGTPDLESVIKSGFATDSEISGARNGSEDNIRELEPWEPDAALDDAHISPKNNGPLSDGWSVEDMFAVNEKRFAIKSDYEEKLYSTAELSIDPNSEVDQEKIRRASEIAREIERNPASKRAAELENDDEERDIVVRSSGSSANNSAATTPTSTSASVVPSKDKYVPVNKRSSGAGDRGGRGPRRGSGYYHPPGRNQGSGEMRMPPRPPPGRGEYGDGGGYVGGSYYAQRPQRYNQQQHHHQMVAQTSHERSPTGPGAPNEWVRGQKRPDMRDSYQVGPPSLPPQGSGPAHNSRQGPPMMPPRQNMDGPAANGNRRNTKLEDNLKKFGKDFQLAPEAIGGAPNQSQGPAGQSAVGSMQGSRLPPQSSPGQTQMPHPPTSVPPPHHQQRRSPDLKNQPGSGYGPHQAASASHPQHQPKLPQSSPVHSQPPPMVRGDVGQRVVAGNEAYHPSHLQHQPSEYANPAHSHQQYPTMMAVQGGQTSGGQVQAPKMQQMSGHVQVMVTTQPPPPVTMAHPPPAQTPHQQLPSVQQQQQQQGDQDQRESSSESIKKSKLNPEAAEFHPQFLRQGSTSAAPPVLQNPSMGGYPVPVQSPPQAAQNSGASGIYGGVATAVPMANQSGYMAANAYQPQQTHSSSMSVQVIPGTTPVYTIQANQQPSVALLSNNAYRPRVAVTAPPQPQQAVVAATGQPIMASPFTPAGPMLIHYPNVHQTNQPMATAQGGAAYQPNTYVINTHRMFPPQYVVPQAPTNGDQSQQQYYAAVSPAMPMAVGSYPQAASVPAISVAPGMQQAPTTMYNQQQGNGNNGHSQTPPTSQQLPPNPSPATAPAAGPNHPPPPNTVNATAVIAYPPSAPTPQSPQYQTAPGVAGAPYPGAPPYVVFQAPGGYMATAAAAGAPQLYNNQGGLPPGAVHIHGAAAMHHGYQQAQAHFISPEYAHQYAAVAAAQQAAVIAAQQQAYHPAVLRSSSVPAFMSAGPVSVASGQGGGSISHQNNHA